MLAGVVGRRVWSLAGQQLARLRCWLWLAVSSRTTQSEAKVPTNMVRLTTLRAGVATSTGLLNTQPHMVDRATMVQEAKATIVAALRARPPEVVSRFVQV